MEYIEIFEPENKYNQNCRKSRFSSTVPVDFRQWVEWPWITFLLVIGMHSLKKWLETQKRPNCRKSVQCRETEIDFRQWLFIKNNRLVMIDVDLMNFESENWFDFRQNESILVMLTHPKSIEYSYQKSIFDNCIGCWKINYLDERLDDKRIETG